MSERIVTLFTGELQLIVYTALLLTIPISWVLLKFYRRAVIRTMEKHANRSEITLPIEPTPHKLPETELKINILDPLSSSDHLSFSKYQKILLQAPGKASLVYLVAGLGYGAVMTWGTLVSGQMSARLITIFITLILFVWPVVLAVQFIAGTTSRRWLQPILIYVGVYLLLTLLAIIINPDAKFIELVALWGLINLPTSLFWWIVLNRRLRAVSPMVLVFMVLALTGSLILLEILLNNEWVQELSAGILKPLGFSVGGIMIVNVLIGLLTFGVIGWFVMRWIRWQYQRQMISDQIITLDSLWLIFSITKGVELVFDGLIWVFVPLMAFLVYKALTVLGFRWLSRQNQLPDSPCLLLLRVFSLGRRSEQLFRAVSTHWRYLGKIRLIAGPDLATTTIEPHEFLDYLSGNLGHNFIDRDEKLEKAIANSIDSPDRDGRYRVEEFFCYGDTWQKVLIRLQQTCDVVLMDLRGFSLQNAGCIFEINTLIDHLPLDRVIFTIDDTTDRNFLQTSIQTAWQNLANDSPNRNSPDPAITLFEFHGHENLPLDRFLKTLCQAGGFPV
ncbi:MAG: hypothetical protein ACK2U1_14890 [Anaerolineales bacterium]